MKMFNTNLPEEKKTIERNINEWIKGHFKKTETILESDFISQMINKILNEQIITVKLCNEEFIESDIVEDSFTTEGNNQDNNVMSYITCFCGSRTKIIKKVLSGRTNRIWILSNYYRHLMSHLEKEDKLKSSKKCIKQNSLKNKIKNYFISENQVNIKNTKIPKTTELELMQESTLPEYTSQSVSSSFSKSTDHSMKWKDKKYSRHEREKRARENNLLYDDKKQPLITNYYEVVNKITKYINENNIFNESLEDLKKNMPWKEIPVETFLRNTDTSILLKSLCESAMKNSSSTSQNANRYDETLKKFCVFLYFVGGRLLYETLQKNLTNSLPSVSSLNRFISSKKENVIEGEYRFKQLKEFLLERDLPLCVWISEDATRLVGKIEYDQISNKIIGFVLPFENGLANINAYLATSANAIGQYFLKNEKANYAYVIMAKPLHDNAPSFCLCIFGTNNKFNYEDVIKRWNVMEKLASDFGIKILGYSSDGDTRLLKAMQVNTYSQKSTHFYVQDTVHIITKLRTRFLKPNVVLPIGDYFISVAHLKILINTFSKDKHLLTSNDLSPEDKMNFRSAEKYVAIKFKKC